MLLIPVNVIEIKLVKDSVLNKTDENSLWYRCNYLSWLIPATVKKKLSNNNFGWILILNIYQRKPQCVSNLLFLSLRQSQKSISL